MRRLPERGRIGIFNRSYYEEVLVSEGPPRVAGGTATARRRGREEVLATALSGYQRVRTAPGAERHGHPQVLPERLQGGAEEPLPRAAGPAGQALEVLFGRPGREGPTGARYMRAYSDCLSATSTEWAPWYVVPADHKWVTRAVVADVITTAIRSLDLKYPEVTNEQRELLATRRNDSSPPNSPRSRRVLRRDSASGCGSLRLSRTNGRQGVPAGGREMFGAFRSGAWTTGATPATRTPATPRRWWRRPIAVRADRSPEVSRRRSDRARLLPRWIYQGQAIGHASCQNFRNPLSVLTVR